MNNTNKKLSEYSEQVIDIICKMNNKTSLKKYIQYFISTDNVIRQFKNASLLNCISNKIKMIKLDKIIKEYNIN